MRILIWVLPIVAVLALIVLSSYIEGKVYAKREKNQDRIIFEVKALFGLIRYRKDVPLVSFAGWCKGIILKAETINEKSNQLQKKDKASVGIRKVRRYFQTAKLLLRKTHGLNDWFRQLFARVECTKLAWNTRIGLEDAPVTGMMVGVVWAVKSTIVGFGRQFVQMKEQPHISVVPQYNVFDFSTELVVVGKIRMAYLMMSGIRLVMRISRDGGFSAWRVVLAPNQKAKA